MAYSPDGKPQAGMGVSVADYDGDGNLDIVKTNFAGDTSSLYHNLGKNFFEDTTFQAGLGRNTRFMGWGVGFFDFDNDGWPDILAVNGHVYPEVGQPNDEQGYRRAQGAVSESGQRPVCGCVRGCRAGNSEAGIRRAAAPSATSITMATWTC